MWNREEPRPAPSVHHPQHTPTPSAAPETRSVEAKEARVATLGSSILIKGTLAGSEDLTVDGRVEGRIEVPAHAVTIGPNAVITAEIVAKVVTVFGSVKGNITAHDSLDIRRGASIEGEVTCTRISIQEGAAFSGKVAMGKRKSKPNGADTDHAPVLATAV
jgi:cytoskeletal protein CcmA (bactofilin family)